MLPYESLIISVALVWLRLSGIVFVAFNEPLKLNPQLKMLLGLSLSLWFGNQIEPEVQLILSQPSMVFILVCIKELMLGIMVGFGLRMLLTLGQNVGELIGYQIGFQNIFMQNYNGSSSSYLGYFYEIIGILIFFYCGFHLLFLKGVFISYELMPLSKAVFFIPRFSFNWIKVFFEGVVFLSFPMLLTSILVQVMFGVVSRMIGQFSLFIIQQQILILVGIFGLSLGLGFFVDQFYNLAHDFINLIFQGIN